MTTCNRRLICFYELFLLLFEGDNLHCSPLERSYKSHILAHYPENVLGNPFDAEAVCMVRSYM